jgi:hypothetical protein
MDYFEATVARILEEQGYWVRENVHVELTKAVKKLLGKPSLPRPEIDIVGYRAVDNALVLFEVKSYLDSHGVQPKHLLGSGWKNNRYKLLTIPALQQAVKDALVAHYRKQGLVRRGVSVTFGLAAGYVQPRFEAEVRKIAQSNSWVYLSPGDLAKAVWGLANGGYENSPFVLTAKLLKRHPPQ